MPCPECDHAIFGTASLDQVGIVNTCASCTFVEEASPSEAALFFEANGDGVAAF